MAAEQITRGKSFATRLLRWGKRYGRRDLPWQQGVTPYRVWISEIMLQQTRVRSVCDYYPRFVERFPDAASLATAELDEVLHLWSGLGYYARARNLHRAAQGVVEQHGGELPQTLEALMRLPGIGRSTAGAILALGSNLPFPILDGNVKRVLSRYHRIEEWPGRPEVERQLWALATQSLPRHRAAGYTQAIMDLGATLCTPTQAQCKRCPLRSDCAAYGGGCQELLPVPGPARKLPLRRTCFIVAQNREGEILLERRPPLGIWGGLWCFPECPPDLDPVDWADTQLGMQTTGLLRADPFVHTFSHFRLEVQAVFLRLDGLQPQVGEPGHRRWLSTPADQRIGLAAPVSRLLAILPALEQKGNPNGP